jgi:beta-glucosidase/6-phospho-beta-glucosidase/beta-galactosidase
MKTETLFSSFWMAGFECSTHRRADGVRLDLLRATAHDRFALKDYRRLAEFGFRGVRDGLRWHRIETAPGTYDWSSWLPMVDAALDAGVEVNWDIFHYGLPDFYDVRSDDFPNFYANYAAAAAEKYLRHTGQPIRACPLNEISFFAWALDENYFPPSVADKPRGWIKRRLIQAAVAAAHAMEAVCPGRRFFWAEPLIHVAPHDLRRETVRRAEANRQSQFEVYDMLMGLAAPELGGHPEMVDAIGLNFYPHNQWYFEGPTIPLGQHEYRPLREMLMEVWQRYSRPLFIAETGAEGTARPAWLHYVCDEVRAAMDEGVPVEAICIYPITDYPGWDNGRHCKVGLLGNADRDGNRPLYEPLLEEVERQQALFAGFDREIDPRLESMANRR